MLSLVPWGWRAGAGITRKSLASQVWRVSARRSYGQGDGWRTVNAKVQPRQAAGPVKQSKDEHGFPVRENDWRENIGVRRLDSEIVRSGTVTTAQPSKTKIEELLAKVEAVERTTEADSPLSTDALLVILLSASYARHAVDDEFALRLMKELRPGHTQPLQACIAVVDRIPSASGSLTGSEGFAYYYRDRPDLRPINETLMTFDQKAQKPGFISFQVSRSEVRNTVHTIQVPLAQTVFSTGIVSTMTHYEYAPGEDGVLHKQREKLLESLTVPLGFTERDTWLRMHTPLVPLTPARVVRNSMGNIVRTVSKAVVRAEHKEGSFPSGPQPASTELEQAVSSYFKALKIPPEPVQVWALVMPFTRNLVSSLAHQNLTANSREKWLRWLEFDAIHQFWLSNPGEDNHPPQGAVSAAIMGLAAKTGGRLCRVLSGGGGWGKKAGLLSLDPDVKYSVRDLRSDKGWEFNLESDDAVAHSKQQALGEVVKEGDEIQFFILPKGTELSEQDEHFNQGLYWQETRSAVFGTIPSTIDATDDSRAATEARPPSTMPVIHEPGMFGALSETGLALTTGLHYPQSPHPGAPKAVPIKSVTKFDVPLSKIRIGQGVGPLLSYYRPPEENNSKASEALNVELGEEIGYFEAATDAMRSGDAQPAGRSGGTGPPGRRAYSTQNKPSERVGE